MSDAFASTSTGLESPATKHAAVTPSDSTDLDPKPRGLFIKAAGDVSITDELGVTILYTSLAAGTLLPFRAKRVNASGTTATVIAWS